MKYNGQNIICDSDITMTGRQIGHSLSDVIDSQQDDINSLKSNIKWIYKYGGVGSGSGGGTSSDVDNSLKYLIEINDTSYVNNSEVNFGKQGLYRFKLKLFKIQGRTFDIKITYPLETGLQIIQRKILPTSNPELTETLDLQVNGLLYVSISDDEGNVAVYNLNYIVTAYHFTINYVYGDHSVYYPVDNNIYVNDIKQRGLLIDFHSTISSDYEPGTAKYTYSNWAGEVFEYELNRGSEHIYLDPGIAITNENAGNYTFLIQPAITLEGKTSPELIPQLKLQDNLIPTNCYLKIVTDGILYKDNNVEEPYKYYTGATSFKITPYQGPLNSATTYYLNVYLDGVEYTTPYPQLEDQVTYNLDLVVEDEGWHSVKFHITRNNESYETTQYFYTTSPLGAFTWYPTSAGRKILPTISFKHKYAYSINDAIQIPGLTSQSLISKTTQQQSSTHVLNIDWDEYKTYDQLLAFGIKYDPLNSNEEPIIILQNTAQTASIQIYQDRVIVPSDDKGIPIYLPKDDFHLLTIYKRALRQVGGNKQFEWNVYLDGVLEGASSVLTQDQDCWSLLTLSNQLYQINYIELSYFEHTNTGGSNTEEYSAFITDPKSQQSRTYFNDLDVLYHFYSYKLTYYPESITDDFKAAYEFAASCFTDYSTNRVKTDAQTITNIAQNIDIPVLLIHYIEPKKSDDPNYIGTGEGFLSWMEKSYNITEKPAEINLGYNVDVWYSPGKQALQQVKLNSDALFKLYLQGTSTLIYESKNYDLVLETDENSEKLYLYTPNFKQGDYSTFLPEKRFTIKADMVDSSHSNNATIGKFVNTICTPFAGAKQNTDTQYSNYIKNTLQGFPILLFIQNSYYKNVTTDLSTDDYYFIGISSFNLGRDSEFNLGYKDLRLLPSTMTEGMQVISIDKDKELSDGTVLTANSYLSGFGVAEIQENRNYFDFSQYDDSILFQIESNSADTDYMFDKMKSNSIQDMLKPALRTLVESVSKSGGYIYDILGKNMLEGTSSDPAYSYTIGYKYEIPQNLVGNYKKQLTRYTEGSDSKFRYKGLEIKGEVSNLKNTLIADNSDPTNPVIPTIDYRSLSEYYVICMALGLLDSVLKNLNVKTWNNRTFYTAFYDMDTSLGKDNAGNNSNYICFSDYWLPQETIYDGYTVLEQAKSYKDWFDPNVMGFDIPSTYLFALVKYGHHILASSTQELKDWYPNNLWARMRRSSNTLNNWIAPTGTNMNHVGCLRNADYFVNTFYGDYLSKVPDCFFNLNYRKKYLIFKEGQYEPEAYKKFSGRRIYYVKDWLHSRFHLLDLYFNLPNINDPILTYNLDSQTWNIQENQSYVQLDSTFIDQSNKDIVVLQNIFSTTNSVKYSTDVKLVFTSEEYSPICTTGETIGRYIAKDSETEYTFSFASAGKSLSLGGSGNWLTVSDINSVIQGGTLYVNSDKLKILKGTSNPYPEVPPQQCSSWNITMPSLQEVMLTHREYSGELNFSASEEINWANLKSINIQGSKLGLKLSSVPIQTVNASNIISSNDLSITNCTNLQAINYHGSRFNNIQLTFPLKNSNIDTTNVSFSPNYMYDSSKDAFIVQNNTNFVLCSQLQVTCTKNNGKIYISNQNYTGTTDNGLQTLNLKGYTHIYIDKCNFLHTVNIIDPENVQVLKITNCGSNATSFSINSNIPNIVDLRAFSNLDIVELTRTKKFDTVYLKDYQKLAKSAFTECSSLKYVNGNNIKLGESNLFSWTGFTLRQADKTTLCSFDFTGVTSMSNVFYASAVTLDTFLEFNNVYKNYLRNITSTENMWGRCSGLTYSVDDLLADYQANTCRIDLSMYSGVTNANGMFSHCHFSAVHPKMLQGFGSSNGFTANYLFGFGDWTTTEEITLPLDWLNYVTNKVKSIQNRSEHTTFKIVKYNTSTQILDNVSTFKPSTFFGGTPSKLQSITNWNFDSNHILEISNDFTKFPSLNTITKSFCKCACKVGTLDYSLNGLTVGFLYEKPNINVSGSFGFNNSNSITVDYDNFINWEADSIPNIFQFIQGWDELRNVFDFNKTISNLDNFQFILRMLLSKCKSTQLAHVFQNCKILNNTNDNSEEFINYLADDSVNKSVQQIPYLFYNLQLYMPGFSDSISQSWDWNLFKKLPNLTTLRYAFYQMKFAESLPFNLFRTRYVLTNSSIYVTKGDSTSRGTLYQHLYTNKIKDMEYAFYGCTFDEPRFLPFESSYSTEDILSPDFVLYSTEEGYQYLQQYYLNTSNTAVVQTLKNYDYADFNKEADYVQTAGNICGVPESAPSTYSNYTVYTDKLCPIIPPDIFYSCTADAKLNFCFANTNLQGYIPDNLFKVNCTQPSLTSFLQNTIIIPKLYKEKLYNNSLTDAFNVYYYIGSNFVNTENLNNAFDCGICLPYTIQEISGLTSESMTLRNLYVFCFTDSFQQAKSYQNMFPRNINPLHDGEKVMCAGNNQTNSLLNCMYDKASELEVEYTAYGYTYDSTTGEYKDSDGNLVNSRPTATTLGKLGFKSYKTTGATYDKVMNYLWVQFGYGYAFDSNINLSTLSRSNKANWILELGESSGDFGVSPEIVLPYMNRTNSDSIKNGVMQTYYDFTNNKVVENLNSGSITIYKDCVANYNDAVDDAYNYSKQTSVHSINFL